MSNELCKGCISYAGECTCGIEYQIASQICPCASCMVKMICDATCGEWMKYYLLMENDI